MLKKKQLFLFFVSLFFCLNLQNVFSQKNDLLTTKSGLRYKIIKKGNGKFAKVGDRVWVHYFGKLSNDSIFESTQMTGEKSFYLGYGQLIKAWEEGLKLVSEEGIIQLIVPPHLGYGTTTSYKGIKPNKTLIFEIALLQIDDKKPITPYETKGIKAKKTKEGITYYPLKIGTGKKAKIGDNAYIHYTGYLADSSIFDSSLKNLEAVRVTVGGTHIFKGWSIALQQMNKGSKFRFIIPHHLAYAEKGYKNIIPPNSDLTMDIEMQKIVPEIEVKKWNAKQRDTLKTKSGLKYIIFEKGKGSTIKDSCVVELHYSGYFTNGKLFDSSVKRQTPIKIPIGISAIIEGWDEAIKLMRKGAEYQFFIPSKLAYGKEGIPNQVPPNADLIFDIQIIDVIF